MTSRICSHCSHPYTRVHARILVRYFTILIYTCIYVLWLELTAPQQSPIYSYRVQRGFVFQCFSVIWTLIYVVSTSQIYLRGWVQHLELPFYYTQCMMFPRVHAFVYGMNMSLAAKCIHTAVLVAMNLHGIVTTPRVLHFSAFISNRN